MNHSAPSGFGLIVVGNEVLDGRVTDGHFAAARDLLGRRHIDMRYSVLLPDRADILEAQLRWAMSRAEPFFCCGGIGATPDDLTRQCAAAAAGVGLVIHPEGAAILRERFGDGASGPRLRMVEFPAGATLIPNPVNRVPGFRIRNGHFLPGFPSMAAPMMAWVLETCYPAGTPFVARAVRLPGAREADLADLMEHFVKAHPTLSFSSLPRFTNDGTEVILGLRGNPRTVEEGMRALLECLKVEGVVWEMTE